MKDKPKAPRTSELKPFELPNNPKITYSPRPDMTKRNTITDTVFRTGIDTLSEYSPRATSTSMVSKSDRIAHIARCLMLDTLAFDLLDRQIRDLGYASCRIDELGQAVAQSKLSYAGSYSDAGKQSFRIEHSEADQRLSIEGSGAMRFQSHNVVASGDVSMLVYAIMDQVNKEHGLQLPPALLYQLALGYLAEMTRIDAALLLKVPQGIEKSAFINALAIAAIKSGTNTSLYIGETVYFDQHSQSDAQKIYDKAAELKRARKGGLPDVGGVEDLEELNEETVRVESVFRKKCLTRIATKHGGLPHPCLFTKEMVAEMVIDQLEKFACIGHVMCNLDPHELLSIALPYRSTIAHWQNHVNLRDMLKSERVLKDHARYIWQNHKINIFAPPPDDIHVPMMLGDIVSPENFIPVPAKIRSNPTLFFELDMAAERKRLLRFPRSGIGFSPVYPYRRLIGGDDDDLLGFNAGHDQI